MKIKTSELFGPALDWAVAKCEYTVKRHKYGTPTFNPKTKRIYETEGLQQIGVNFGPSTDWAQGGSLLQAEMMEHGMSLASIDHEKGKFAAYYWSDDFCELEGIGPTPLIAAMRALVQRKLGDEIDIPKELT